MEILLLIGIFIIYFLPTMSCFRKKCFSGVFILNLFLGWTFLGWVAALIWAVTAE
jgi:uncharacterized membrane protein YqaE (UPF0057 family)